MKEIKPRPPLLSHLCAVITKMKSATPKSTLSSYSIKKSIKTMKQTRQHMKQQKNPFFLDSGSFIRSQFGSLDFVSSLLIMMFVSLSSLFTRCDSLIRYFCLS
nr:hypothetical protein [Tanacetum cinerariifolium]